MAIGASGSSGPGPPVAARGGVEDRPRSAYDATLGAWPRDTASVGDEHRGRVGRRGRGPRRRGSRSGPTRRASSRGCAALRIVPDRARASAYDLGTPLGGGRHVDVAPRQGQHLLAGHGLLEARQPRQGHGGGIVARATPAPGAELRVAARSRRATATRTPRPSPVLGRGDEGAGRVAVGEPSRRSGTAGSTSQVMGRAPAATPKSSDRRELTALGRASAAHSSASARLPSGSCSDLVADGQHQGGVDRCVGARHERQEGAGATIGDRVAAGGVCAERVHPEPVDPGLVGAELVGGDADGVGGRRPRRELGDRVEGARRRDPVADGLLDAPGALEGQVGGGGDRDRRR